MSIFRKSIFTAASPNTQFDDVKVALGTLLNPMSWRNEDYSSKFKFDLQSYLGIDYLYLIDSGRSALQIAIESIGIKSDDEVIVPSFTCVVVANAVSFAGAKPVYLDTSKEDFNADYSNLKEVITKRTRIIVVQHTFGKKVEVEDIRSQLNEINRNDILIFEDFAHIIKKDLNLKGDIGFTTFGIEKVMSTVRGGAVFTNNETLSNSLFEKIEKLPEFPTKQTIKSLLNPIFWYIAIPLHSVGVGRFTIGALIRSIWRKLGFLGIMVEERENKSEKPDWFPAKMSPALSRLGLVQLRKLEKYNSHRQAISIIYHLHLAPYSDNETITDSRVYLRYPILVPDEEKFKKVWDFSRDVRVTLGNWFASPLYGSSVNLKTYEKLCYVPKLTPTTETKTGLTMNLPTSINMNQERARELATGIKKILES